jgi:osmoprotectant transport system ATP-binding protein
MLRMINRLVPVSAGSIRVDGVDVAQIRPEALRRRMGYVIQSIGLFPHWTVARNVAAVPELLAWPRAKIRARVDELLTMLQLDPRRFAEQFPHQLSLGQQQRVGIARALAADPDILLMDEPFAALDAQTREIMQTELLRIWEATRATVLFITHQIDEAVYLSDRVLVFSRRPGKIQEDIRIELPRPREFKIKRSAEFTAYVARIWTLIENAVRESVMEDRLVSSSSERPESGT